MEPVYDFIKYQLGRNIDNVVNNGLDVRENINKINSRFFCQEISQRDFDGLIFFFGSAIRLKIINCRYQQPRF